MPTQTLPNATKEKASTHARLFQKVVDSSIAVGHRHIENYYNDFDKEVLLPHQMSMLGPNIAVGDLNMDNFGRLYRWRVFTKQGGYIFFKLLQGS